MNIIRIFEFEEIFEILLPTIVGEALTKKMLTKPQAIPKTEQPITKGYAIVESIINSCFFYFLLNNKKEGI